MTVSDAAAIPRLALGTAGLGMDYGIPTPDNRPGDEEARAIITAAAAAGIALFDTAPAYGTSETLLGEVLDGDPAFTIVTKINPPRDAAGRMLKKKPLTDAIRRSLDSSRRRLRLESPPVVLIHSATADILGNDEFIAALQDCVREGLVGRLGASVYTTDEARVALDVLPRGMLQVPYNLLDQRMTPIFDEAAARDVPVMVRSVFLKGALTHKARWLPADLHGLREHIAALCNQCSLPPHDLSALALRFALRAPVAAVCVGARSRQELRALLDWMTSGPDPGSYDVQRFPPIDQTLLDPRTWPLP